MRVVPREIVEAFSRGCFGHGAPFRGKKKAPIASGFCGPTLSMPFDIYRIFFRKHPIMEGLPFSGPEGLVLTS